MRFIRLLVLLSAVSLLWTAPASAMGCRDWSRLGYDQKPGVINGMIQDAISGQKGRSYHVNRNAIARCLQSRARDIEYEFDDACASSRTSGMQALNHIFKDYIWSCVN